MKKVTSMMMALLLLMNISFGYTLTVTYNGNQTVREVEGGESVIIGLSSRDSANYTVDTNNTILKYYGNRRQFVMPEGNVGITITAQDDGGSGVDILNMQVGDYVEYHPTVTNCDVTSLTRITQAALNPSETTQWRVLSNDGMTVELVSADNAGVVTLGNPCGDSYEEDIEIAKMHYKEIGKILREISEAYIDESFAVGGRGLGYKPGSSVEEIDTTLYPLTYEETVINANNGFPYSDTYYIDDFNVLKDYNMLPSELPSWFVSRKVEVGDSVSYFKVYFVAPDGIVYDQGEMFRDWGNGRFSLQLMHNYVGVRPVVILKPGIKATPVGTEGNSWKLESGASNTSTTYTVSYNGNGGTGTTASSTHTYGTQSTLRTNGFSKDGYVFDSWNTKADGSGIKYTNEQAVKFVYGTAASNVATLYAQWREPYFAELAEIGDYVEYHPTATTCDLTEITGITQDALNPSVTTQWRVLSNDGTTVELVSADSVGVLTLGAKAELSDEIFTEGSAEDFQLAKTHYGTIIQMLRRISEAYTDGEFATAGRGLGWNRTSAETIPIATISYEYIDINEIRDSDGDPYSDTYCYENGWRVEDVEILRDNNMMHTETYGEGNVWLASRYLASGGGLAGFFVRFGTSDGSVEASELLTDTYAGSVISLEHTHGVRPVIILKSGITATPVGTEGNSWKLN